MEKAHSRIKWENYPSIATPLNETNLNKMDVALDEVDNRVLGLDTAKLDKATANTMVKDISFAENTGIFTITLLDGTKKTIDTKLEKIATNFSYDYQTQKLNLTLVDGTIQELDLTSLISQVEFMDSETIDISVDSTGKVSAIVKDGSITEAKLQPNYLAEVKVEVAKAKSSSDSSYENAETARESATEARQFRDEAEQFRNQAEAMSGINIATTEVAGIVKPDGTTIRVDPDGTIHADSGTVNYNDLENKPKINGVEIAGELTTEDLNIDLGTVDYEELENKPSINNIELSGNKTLQELGIQPQGDYPTRDSLKPYVFSNPTNNLLATEAGTPLDAVQGKVLYDRQNDLNVARKTGKQYNTPEEFVADTATEISIPNIGRFKDLGGFVRGNVDWYRYVIVYQNFYVAGSASNISGNGILWDGSGNEYKLYIKGNKDSGITLNIDKVITETELNNALKPIDVPYEINSEKVEIASNLMSIKKSGGVVVFTMALKAKVDLSTAENLVKFKTYTPSGRYEILGRFQGTGIPTSMLPLVLYAHGDMNINSATVPSGANLLISGSYITNAT